MTTRLLRGDAPETVEAAAELIRLGGLVAIPTETVYGLGANGLDGEAVLKIFLAKGRPQDNPLILHVSGPDQVETFCHHVPPVAYTLMERFWPGPLTLVLPVRPVVPSRTTAGLSTVAVRCPATALTRKIIDAAGVPIAAPSANTSGKPSPTTAQHVLHDMDGRIDAVVDGGPCAVGVESTIVDLTAQPPRLLRPGGVTLEALREVLGDLAIDRAVTGEVARDTVVRAPGMKYTHYTPAGAVIIVSGPAEQAARYIRARLNDAAMVLCFREELSLYPADRAVAYGALEDPSTLARGLFGALRNLDSPEIQTIYARCPTGGGVEAAVANRLKKAAGFHIVDSRRSLVIGITGPTGSGKTTFLQCISGRGGCVLDLDQVYHGLLETNTVLLQELAARFPETVKAGRLDRKALGAVVFADKAALRDLNAITGKHILEETRRQVDAAKAQGAPIVAMDAIQLLETELRDWCDCTVAVVAPVEARVRRLMARDAITEEYARLRIAAQPDAAFYERGCTYTVRNDGSQACFEARCQELLDEILKD